MKNSYLGVTLDFSSTAAVWACVQLILLAAMAEPWQSQINALQQKLSDASTHAEALGVIDSAAMDGAPGWYSCIDPKSTWTPESVAAMAESARSNGAVYGAAARVSMELSVCCTRSAPRLHRLF